MISLSDVCALTTHATKMEKRIKKLYVFVMMKVVKFSSLTEGIQDGEQDLRPGCGCIFEGLWGIKNRTSGLCLMLYPHTN